MVGKYEIEVYNNRVHFYLEVKRNITIIQGDSATGKTTLIGLISDHDRLGAGSGVTVKCDIPCVALSVQDWHHFITSRSGYIIFIDENLPALKSAEFAEAVATSDNYFVIVYRDSLPRLSYSIDEIYGMHEDRESQKYIKPKRVYNTLFQIYNPTERPIEAPDIIVTEDSNSGYEFYEEVMSCVCKHADGKSKIAEAVLQSSTDDNCILAVADGAAFGSDMQRFSRMVRSLDGKCLLYAPESFEYLLLKSGVVNVDRDMIDHPYDYADSSKYLSWERFFTAVLSDTTRNTIYQYSKIRLNKAFLTKGNVEKILEQLPPILIEKKKDWLN